MATLPTVKLQYQSKGGMNQFLLDFNQVILDLNEAKAPLTPSQLKPMLLNAIEDKAYKPLITNLHCDLTADYEGCMIELAAKSITVEAGSKKRQRVVVQVEVETVRTGAVMESRRNRRKMRRRRRRISERGLFLRRFSSRGRKKNRRNIYASMQSTRHRNSLVMEVQVARHDKRTRVRC